MGCSLRIYCNAKYEMLILDCFETYLIAIKLAMFTLKPYSENIKKNRKKVTSTEAISDDLWDFRVLTEQTCHCLKDRDCFRLKFLNFDKVDLIVFTHAVTDIV